jgi:nucleotide-binding universal stress UspA family protein
MTSPAGHEAGIVAVAYSGSEASQLAVRWAAGYAAAAGLSLQVVHAWVWPVFTKNLGPVKGVAGSGLRHSAEAILAEGIELARSALSDAAGGPAVAPPGVPRAVPLTGPVPGATAVDGVMEAGLPAPVLRDAAREARLLVVGSRGLGAVLGQVAGSVCLDLAGSAPCPLMIVRRPRSPGRPVIVGVDDSPRSPGTVAGAIRLAKVLGDPVLLVHVDPQRGGPREEHGRHARQHGQELLDHAVDDARKLASGLEVSGVLRSGHTAARELLDAAAGADVLVLGTHRLSAGPGNTVSAVLHKALCNVLVSR